MQSIGELAEPLAAVSPDALGEVLYRRFEDEPDTLAVAVVDAQGRPVGLVERHTFSLKMASQYGRSLYAVRPISLLMDSQPLIVEASASVAAFTGESLSTRRSDLLKGFIVVEDGRYLGVGSPLALLQAANETNRLQAEAMTTLAGDLQSAETQAQERESSFRLLFDGNPVAMCVWDAETLTVLAVNEAAVAQYGYSRDELLGRPIMDVMPGAERMRLKQMMRQGQDQENDGGSWRHTRADGSEIEVLPLVRSLVHEGRAARLAALFDITKRERDAELLAQARDAAEAANLAKSEFLANMSHEIRTPLNGVVGIAGVLAQTRLDERQAEMVKIIESSAVALNGLLSDILDIARVEAGRLTVTADPFHPAEVVREAARLFDIVAQEKGLALKVEIAPGADRPVDGDAARIKQILVNLVSNAVKFTESGRVTLRLEAGDAGCLFEVEDTGVGFPMEKKDALFGRFQQADGSITRRFGGSGLGLAISQSLAELMGGSLDAVSEAGRGSTFALRLPLRAAEACGAEPQRTEAVQAHGGVRVLVADDHATNRRVVELIIGSAGGVLTSVENGEQAVQAFGAGGFDIILMDMQMPVMDGLSAIRAIRAAEAAKGLRRTPILALTANAMPEHIRASLDAGADGHIAKPVTAATLLAGVTSALTVGAPAAARDAA